MQMDFENRRIAGDVYFGNLITVSFLTTKKFKEINYVPLNDNF